MKTEKQKRAEYTKLIHEGENIVIAPPGTINGEEGGITDVYTKAEVDTMIGTIDDQLDDVYTKEEVDEAIGELDISDKMDKNNPKGTGSFSLNQNENSIIGNYSVSLGQQNSVTGNTSFAFGSDHNISGNLSSCFGLSNQCNGLYSFAAGRGSQSNRRSQFCFGEFNIYESALNQRGLYVEIVGNGNSNDERSNARTLDWSGNEWLSGYILPVNGVILPSSTPNSTKYFKLSVDDTGTITATEVTI